MLADLGWRDLVIAICALLAIYAVFVFFQISRLKQEKLTSFEPSSRPAVDAYEAIMRPDRISGSPAPVAPSEPAREVRNEKTRQFSALHEQSERVLHDGMAAENFQSRVESRQKMVALEQDVDQLRKEVGRLRAEILLLREACQKPDKLSPSSPQVSSFYSDAMQMAAQGESMENISQLCGISRAEAELVKALVKDRGK